MAMELLAGHLVTSGGMSAVFVGSFPHPVWDNLDLVVWVMEDGSVSLDALRRDQDVGEARPDTPAQRAVRVRQAVVDGVGGRSGG
jgi:hypothetical protein